jgi:hypothetical protein
MISFLRSRQKPSIDPTEFLASHPKSALQKPSIYYVFRAVFERVRTVGKVMVYLVEHDVRMPIRVHGGVRKGELEWHRRNRASLQNLFRNPIYAGAYVYGLRPTDRRRQKPGRPQYRSTNFARRGG